MCHIMSNRNISQLICNGSGNLLLGACQWSNGQQPFIKKKMIATVTTERCTVRLLLFSELISTKIVTDLRNIRVF